MPAYQHFNLPYGNRNRELVIPEEDFLIDLLFPGEITHQRLKPEKLVERALSSPLGIDYPFEQVNQNTHVGITINDKTRPVPNSLLLFPLIQLLNSLGVPDSHITLFIASGTHTPMRDTEFSLILNDELIRRFVVFPHNCDDPDNLYEIGKTTRNTPVFVNRKFYESDLKITLGDIELHHFAGFSGGVKSAAIGMCGRITINANHKLLLDPHSTLGVYDENPLRLDIEEIGKMIKVDLALNAVLDENKQILQTFFGDPVSVMYAGIHLVRSLSQVNVVKPYDLIIASAGGYPKDINLYQAQKAMTHASLFCKPDGIILLVAECREGIGSQGYLDFMKGISSVPEVIKKFSEEDFSVGPHKAFQIARILENHRVLLASSIDNELVRSLLLEPVNLESDLIPFVLTKLKSQSRIAVLPYATACIPVFPGGVK